MIYEQPIDIDLMKQFMIIEIIEIQLGSIFFYPGLFCLLLFSIAGLWRLKVQFHNGVPNLHENRTCSKLKFCHEPLSNERQFWFEWDVSVLTVLFIHSFLYSVFLYSA